MSNKNIKKDFENIGNTINGTVNIDKTKTVDVKVKPNETKVPKEPTTKEPEKEVTTTNKVEETPAKKDTIEKTTKPVEQKEPEKDLSIKIGDKVTIKENAKTVTGQIIPDFAFKNTYIVDNILDDRIVVTCGPSLKYGVAKSDIIK